MAKTLAFFFKTDLFTFYLLLPLGCILLDDLLFFFLSYGSLYICLLDLPRYLYGSNGFKSTN